MIYNFLSEYLSIIIFLFIALFSKDLKVGDVVVATTAHTDNAMSKKLLTHMSPSVTYELLEKYMKFAPENTKVGSIMSSDWFYNPDQNWWKEHQKLGTLAVEMETHILYALANKFNKKALSVCTVADHFENKIVMTTDERERSFSSMVGTLLESLC